MIIEKPFPEILFERMRQEDLQQVMVIEKESFPDPWHISFFKRQLRKQKKQTFLYVARINNKVIGYIVFYIFCGEGHIMNIAVDSKYRRHGVGRYILVSTLEIVQTQPCNEVFLEVAVNNTAARQLYQQFGFQIYGIRKRYYYNGEDAYVLRKEMQG